MEPADHEIVPAADCLRFIDPIGANFSGATSGTINSLNNIINSIIIHYNHVNVIT